jgi:hypothetical protein
MQLVKFGTVRLIWAISIQRYHRELREFLYFYIYIYTTYKNMNFFTSALPSFQVRSSAHLLPSSSPAVARLHLLLLTAPTPSHAEDAQRHRLSQRPEDKRRRPDSPPPTPAGALLLPHEKPEV